MGTHCSSSMLGRAVSSSTPKDFQPNSHKGVDAFPQISRQAMAAPPGMAYAAVGMQRALDSAIGLPSRSTSALWMLVLLMPAEVSRNFMIPLLADFMGAERLLKSLSLRLKQNDPRTVRLRFSQLESYALLDVLKQRSSARLSPVAPQTATTHQAIQLAREPRRSGRFPTPADPFPAPGSRRRWFPGEPPEPVVHLKPRWSLAFSLAGSQNW